MRIRTLASALLLVAGTAVLPACGGGGNGFGISSQDISVTSAVLPLALSGHQINHVIPLTGGCGGPYVMAVVVGQLPPGLALNEANHSIEGVILQPGNYAFTIQIDDTGCTPFATTTQAFTWNIGVGPVVIAACDPPIIPVASYNPANSVPFGDIDGMKTTIYGSFAVFNFVIAGGQGPYTFEIIDDPNDPLDSNWGNIAMPQGMNIPPFSSSFIGAPQQTGGSIPFRFTFRVTDALNGVGYRKLQWKVDTPPIIVATTVLPNGKCGTIYSQSVQIVDGVPPFEFELTSFAANNATIVWQSPLAPIINGGAVTTNVSSGRSNIKIGTGLPGVSPYPGAAVAGPYSGILPEGVFLRENVGTFSGVPRRLGTFTCFMHVFSTTAPNEYGQHLWHTYAGTSFANSEPPNIPTPAYAFGQFNSWLVEGALLGAAPYSTIPEFELGVPYNPDAGSAGLSLLAVGGVAKDGLTDGPHLTQINNIDGTLPPPVQEYAGGYTWSIDWNPLLLGTVAPPGVVLTAHTGILSVPIPALLVRQSRQVFGFTALDEQLPTANRHSISARAAFSVGPDKVIITESGHGQASAVAVAGFNNHLQKVRVVEPLSSGAVFRNVANATELSPPGIPGTTAFTALTNLLTDIDLVRVSVNPTGWWDDTHHLNPSGARPFQHSDMNKSYTYSNMGWQSGSNPLPWNPDASAVDLPAAPSVAANPLVGIYNQGGRLYGFQSATSFGVFIVREDARIYVPIAIDYSTGYTGFGDGMVEAYGADVHSATQIAQLTISPNGRFGAMKLKTNSGTGQAAFNESASSTKIILFSLTGETPFAGSAWKIISTGSNGSSNQGVYQYANSLALTDSYLYYLCGNHLSTYSSWKEHNVYRYTLTGGAAGGALLAPNAFTAWKNDGSSIANMMSTPFQRHDNPTQLSQVIGFGGTGSFSASFTTIAVMDTEMYAFDSWNTIESGVAPMPFRVSKDGRGCAILAGQETNNFGATVDQMNHHVWLDFNGSFKQLSTLRRHSPQGGSRGYTLSRGPNAYKHWGTYFGPTTGFEISDDALKVAVVVTRQTTAVSPTSSTNWYNFRQDVVAWTTANSWTSSSEIQVTGTETAATAFFGGSHNWRFGALVFTADSAGLVFWAGYGSQNQTLSPTYQAARNFSGTMYSYNFSTSAMRSILATPAGGGAAGIAAVSAPFNPTFGLFNGAQGRLRPMGGFISRSRNFLYLTVLAAVQASEPASCTLVGFNIRSLNTATNINGKIDGEGFRVAGQPAQRGLCAVYAYGSYYPLEYRYYAPGNVDGCGGQVMAKTSGYVFYGTHFQSQAPYQVLNATSSFAGGPEHPTNWGDYGSYTGQIEGFSADVGGAVSRITQTSLSQTNGTTARSIHHIECTNDGKALAFVYCSGNTQYNYAGETVGYVQKIGFDATTGALLAGKQEWTSTLNGGRVGDAMAIDSTGSKLYVPFGGGDENAKQITEVSFNSGTNAFTTRTFGAAMRYNVLSAGR